VMRACAYCALVYLSICEHPQAICPRAPKTSAPSRECCFFSICRGDIVFISEETLRRITGRYIAFVCLQVERRRRWNAFSLAPTDYIIIYIYMLPRTPSDRQSLGVRVCTLVHYMPIIITVVIILYIVSLVDCRVRLSRAHIIMILVVYCRKYGSAASHYTEQGTPTKWNNTHT
jgi:hypothetical protein